MSFKEAIKTVKSPAYDYVSLHFKYSTAVNDVNQIHPVEEKN